jgi:hypothetical protein
MKIPSELELLGAKVFLSNAIRYIVRGKSYDEWGDGHYLDPAVENATNILQKAMWYVERDLRLTKEARNGRI